MRDPPGDWFIAAEHGWKVPEEDKVPGEPRDSKWQQAIENTINVGRALGIPAPDKP